jgi:hypothetical protein
MARAKASKQAGWPVCPVKNIDCLAYYPETSRSPATCGLMIKIQDILDGKEACKRGVEDAIRRARKCVSDG